jgi:ABC-type multidrug transport system ATPase subunit/ABC-type multidrug transport system permease subunit
LHEQKTPICIYIYQQNNMEDSTNIKSSNPYIPTNGPENNLNTNTNTTTELTVETITTSENNTNSHNPKLMVKTPNQNHHRLDGLRGLSTMIQFNNNNNTDNLTLDQPDRPRREVEIEFYNLTLKIAPKPQGLLSQFRQQLQQRCQKKNTTKLANKPQSTIAVNNISGTLPSSAFTALMGPSGSGKSSLLNILAARTRKNKRINLTGTIRWNHYEISSWSDYRRVVAYVMQDDLMFSFITVIETLRFAASLRLPRNFTPKQRQDRVEEVISALGLIKCRDTIIRNISGGERKRVSVALELLRGPHVLLLDEPTSGLDSHQALNLCTTLKALSNSGRTICASIHQPRSAIYCLFDKLIILSEGQVMYQGPGGNEIIHFFSRLGFHMPANYNPSDFVLDVVAVDVGKSPELEQEARLRIKLIAEEYHKQYVEHSNTSVHNDDVEKQGGNTNNNNNNHSTNPIDEIDLAFQAPFGRQLQLLILRALSERIRDPAKTIVPFTISTFFGILLGLLFFQTGLDLTQSSIQDKVGFCFFVTLNQSFSFILSAVSTFPVEKLIVERERASQSYRVSAYFLSKVLSDLPSLYFPFHFATLAYWLAYINPSGEIYIAFVGLVLLGCLCAGALGLFLSAITNSAGVAQGLATPIMLVLLLVSGFYASSQNLPDWLSWLQWLSPLRYCFAGLIWLTFNGIKFSCEDVELQGCVPNGNAVITRLGFTHDSVGRSYGILVCITVGLWIITYLVLLWKKSQWVVVVVGGSSSTNNKSFSSSNGKNI